MKHCPKHRCTLFPEIEYDRKQLAIIADALLARATGQPRRWNDDGTPRLPPRPTDAELRRRHLLP